MKKLLNATRRPNPLFKFDLKMKLSALFVLMTLFTMQANNTYGQRTNLTLNLENVSVGQFLDEIENNTEFEFVYKLEDVDLKRIISVTAKKEKIASLLNRIFKNTETTFNLNDRRVYLIKREGTRVTENSKMVDSKPILQASITGIVTDENGAPLPGASIVEKGTTNGTQTDFDGNFNIVVSGEKAKLVVSYIGYTSQEIPVGQQTEINIQLQSDASELDEVVLIGYGTQSKGKVTGAISKVSSEVLNQVATASFDQALSGTMAGIQLNQSSNQPGQDSQIVIRGLGTLTAGSAPLIVVDGVPLTEGSPLSSVNPNDIESLDVLKDAASASIYGSRAANGVILITTKRGKGEGMQVNLNVFSGIQMRSDGEELMNAYEAAQFFKEARDQGYVSSDPANRSSSDNRATRLANGASLRQLTLDYTQPWLDGVEGLTDTNWLDEVYQTANINNYHLSLSGSNTKSNYYVSLGYLDQEGILIGTATDKATSSIKVNTEITDNLKFGIALNTSYDFSDVVANGAEGGWNSFPSDPAAGVFTQYPFFPVRNTDGSFAISEQIRANVAEDGSLSENQVAMTLLSKNTQRRFRAFGSAFLEYEIIEGLKAKTSLGGDFRSFFYDYYQPSTIGTYRTDVVNNQSNSSETNIGIENVLSETTLNYNKSFGEHTLDMLGGFSYQQENLTSTRVAATGIIDDNLDNISAGSNFAVTPLREKWRQISYFGRLQYDYGSKYLLSGSIRTDGSSRFGINNQWGVFKSLSAGWVISNEGFFPEDSFVNYAKLRGSWGETGNNQIGAYGSKALVDISNYTLDNSLAPGFSIATSPNDNLSWERNVSTNLGLDLGFLNNKLSLSAEYYVSNTKDLLLEVPIPQQTGFDSSLQNLGEVQNSGFELELAGQNFKLGELEIGFNANISTNKSEVLALGPDQDQIIANVSGYTFRTKVGGPLAELYGYDVIGVYKTQEEINSTPSLDGTQTGDYIVRDVDGDGDVDSDDRIGLGTYQPDFTYGFGMNMNYRNLDFSFGFNGVEGRKLYDFWPAALLESGEGFTVGSKYYFDNRYHPDNNPDGFLAQPNMGNFSSARRNTRQSSITAQDGSYLRLRNVQIGYSLPKSTLDRIGFSRLRIYVSGNNLFTVTDYRGINPDGQANVSSLTQRVGSPLTQGYTRSSTSLPRIISVGLNLSF